MGCFTNKEQRAEELIAVGKQESALLTLYEFLTSRRTRSVAPASLEPIALLFVQLSVDLRKGFTLKDGLHQFKKNVQVSDNGLPIFENVVRNLIDVATKRLETAQSEADSNTYDDDLEESESPEELLLSAVSSEQSKDRSDRELVTPWLRFLWESYRLVLDLLRNNSQLEVTYSNVVQKAYQFCLKYNRKAEFRKLSDLLRSHISSATQQKYGQRQYNSVDLQDPETLQRHLELRFNQLNVSVKLELWQEAYRSVEDLHSLISSSKRPPKPGMMVSYYENLTKIFLVSDNELFHAASWQKFFNLYSQSPNATEEQLVRYSSIFFLSTLAIPQESFNLDLSEDFVKHSKQRLASLLNLPKAPTRESLIQFGTTKNVYNYVHPSVKKLYQLLEVNFHPLTIRDELNLIIPEIESNGALAQYVKPLTKVILTKLFEQISQVYESIKLDYLIQLATFNGKFELSSLEIESFLLNAGRDGQLSFFIDHDAGVVNFVSDPFGEIIPNSNSSLQSSPADLVRSQLSNLAKTLYASTQYTDSTYAQRQQSLRERLIASATEALAKEREEAEKTRELLEQRKAQLEKEEREREAQAIRDRQRKLEEEKAAEANRAAEEAKRRLEEKMKRDKEAIEFAEKKKLVDEINANGVIKLDVNKLRDLTTEEIKALQVTQLQKDQVDLETRTKALFKKLDHTERAYRKYELPLLEKDSSLQRDRDLAVYEEFKSKKIVAAKKSHEEALELKQRLEKFVPEFIKFKEQVGSEVASKREKLIKEQQAKLDAAKQERLEQVRQERYAKALADYKLALEKEAIEQERAKQEEERRIKEEKRRESLQKLREEREATNKGLDAQAARQREIDALIEAKMNNKGSSSVPTPAASPAATEEAPKKLSFAERMKLKRAQK